MMKKNLIAVSSLFALLITGCVTPPVLETSTTAGEEYTNESDSISERRDISIEAQAAVLPQKLTKLDENTRLWMRRHPAIEKKYRQECSTLGITEAYKNALEARAIFEMTTPFDRAAIERGLELIDQVTFPYEFVEVSTAHNTAAKRKPSAETSKMILLYRARRQLYNNSLQRFKEIDCDYKAIREIPFFAILELELLGLEEKYKAHCNKK